MRRNRVALHNSSAPRGLSPSETAEYSCHRHQKRGKVSEALIFISICHDGKNLRRVMHILPVLISSCMKKRGAAPVIHTVMSKKRKGRKGDLEGRNRDRKMQTKDMLPPLCLGPIERPKPPKVFYPKPCSYGECNPEEEKPSAVGSNLELKNPFVNKSPYIDLDFESAGIRFHLPNDNVAIEAARLESCPAEDTAPGVPVNPLL